MEEKERMVTSFSVDKALWYEFRKHAFTRHKKASELLERILRDYMAAQQDSKPSSKGPKILLDTGKNRPKKRSLV